MLVIDFAVFAALFVKLFMNPLERLAPPLMAATNGNEALTVVGTSTELLIQKLGADGFAPVISRIVTRPQFIVPCRLVILNGDNIQVFEYPDQATASGDASALASKYTSSSRSLAWKERMHIFVDGSLVTFYMGSDAAIIGALDKDAGLALMQPAAPVVLVPYRFASSSPSLPASVLPLAASSVSNTGR
jgi:hypothetical protein